jgi:hypothetical protein
MIEGAERITKPQAATRRIFTLIHKTRVDQLLIHGHLGAQTTATWGRSGTATWGHNPILKNPSIFPVVVTRIVEKRIGQPFGLRFLF